MKGQTRWDDYAEWACKAMGSLFCSSVKIKFSGGHNSMYGQKDLFRHLVVMRGKHGYAEDSSHAEDVDWSSPPLRRGGGRWARYGPYPRMRC